MQSKGAIKLLAILLAIACIYQLSFSFKTRSVEKKAAAYAAAYDGDERSEREQYYLDSVQNQPVYNLGFRKFTYKEIKEKELNLGLDLKGGMNVMLEIQVEDVVKSLAGDSKNDPAFIEAMAQAKEGLRTGKDFIGEFVRSYRTATNGAPLAAIFVSPDRKDITPNSTDAEVEKILRKETDDAIDASFNILRSRIDHFGVTQPNIQRLPNSNRILVELPGVKEPERVRKLLQGSASLEFWTTYNAGEIVPTLMRADQVVKQYLADTKPAVEETVAVAEAADSTADGGLIAEVATAETETAAEATGSYYDRDQNPLLALLNPQFAGGAAVGAVMAADTAAVNDYLALPAVKEMLPADLRFKWAIKGETQQPVDGRFYLYAIKVERPDGRAPLDGSVITDAREAYAQRGAEAEVSMSMNSNGISEWARLTADNVGRCVAIVLDGYVYSAPVVRQKIEGGNSSISGNFTIQEAKDLANVLKSGKVPAPAHIIQDTVVGPSLGQESINAGMVSFVIAFLLVLLYMGAFYKTAGWMADLALLFNVFLLMGVLVSFGAVLTLPGIAGIVLTMGMAVDSNVIIYERIKEELRAGKGLSLAIKDGFSNAYSAIIDGQLTTIITGIVLFVFGNGPVQGFATTLIIGILTSLFSSIFITRLLIEAIVAKFGHISFSRKWSENWLNNIHFDFVGKRKYSYAISGTVIVLSFISFAVFGLNRGVEFTGGRSYVVLFDQPVSVEQVRASVRADRKRRQRQRQPRNQAVRRRRRSGAYRDAVQVRRRFGRGDRRNQPAPLRRREEVLQDGRHLRRFPQYAAQPLRYRFGRQDRPVDRQGHDLQRNLCRLLLADRHRALYHPAVQEMAVGDGRHAFAGARRADRHRSLLDAVCRHAVQLGDQPGLHRCDPDRDRLFDQQHGGDLRPHPRVHRALSETEPARQYQQRHQLDDGAYLQLVGYDARHAACDLPLRRRDHPRFHLRSAVRRSDRYLLVVVHRHSALVRSDARVDQEQG